MCPSAEAVRPASRLGNNGATSRDDSDASPALAGRRPCSCWRAWISYAEKSKTFDFTRTILFHFDSQGTSFGATSCRCSPVANQSRSFLRPTLSDCCRVYFTTGPSCTPFAGRLQIIVENNEILALFTVDASCCANFQVSSSRCLLRHVHGRHGGICAWYGGLRTQRLRFVRSIPESRYVRCGPCPKKKFAGEARRQSLSNFERCGR
mmetsp:Transcript_59630/g.146178  ORF Transcript_59630/g.146178 Transcript_59630/m.146178 type:complete len:207 (+) Transcript_59630:1208-1828(+)